MSICVSRVKSPRCKERASVAMASLMMPDGRRYRRDTEEAGTYKSALCRARFTVMPRLPLLVISALAIGGPACAQSRPAPEAIGSWVLACPDAQAAPGQSRKRMPSAQARGSGPAAVLEVAHRRKEVVPVVALRGMSMQAAVGGMRAVQGRVTW